MAAKKYKYGRKLDGTAKKKPGPKKGSKKKGSKKSSRTPRHCLKGRTKAGKCRKVRGKAIYDEPAGPMRA